MKKALKLAALSLALAVVAAGCGGKSADNVTFVLDWTPNTNHTGLYVALDKGYFREAGLDVTIIQPSEGTADQAVASGTAGFGISYQENVTLARVQGMPLVSVAAVIQHNTSGFGSLREKNIMGPRDFEGRTYGGWGGDIEGAMIRYLMEQEGADPTLVNMLTIGDMDFFMASATGKMDFAWMYEGWTLVEARTRNIDMNYFSISEINEVFDYYTPVIITSEQIITQNPELVRRFMGALARGYEHAIEHPLESARI
ncbi:MAG: ABC transporter substrate-binding protein [Clostridia bacterium]